MDERHESVTVLRRDAGMAAAATAVATAA
jgi:hypothetical protein